MFMLRPLPLVVRLTLLVLFGSGAALPAVATPGSGADEATLDARARQIHAHVLKLDSHVDVLLPDTPEALWGPGHVSRADLTRLRAGGIGAVAFAVAVGPGPRTPEGVAAARAEADAKLAAIEGLLREHPSEVALAHTADEVLRIHREGRIAIIESFLNARSLGTDLAGIDQFQARGVRLFGLTHAGNNDFADSSRPIGAPREEWHGLSPLGRQAVARLNALGVIIDVSQLTPAGLAQVLELSRAPVVASHSAVRALVDSPRNLSDTELDALRDHGGVVQVTAFNSYLVNPPADFHRRVGAVRERYGLAVEFPAGPQGAMQGADALPPDRLAAFESELRELSPRATVRDYVDHIDYVVKRIGIDHVGIGTDFNHGAGIVGFDDESQAFAVTRELVRRGYTEAQIARIWGGNFLRVFRRVEAVARKLKA